MFAAIETHREALRVWEEDFSPEPRRSDKEARAAWDAGQEVFSDAEDEAAWALLDVEPTTIAGCLAFLAYLPRFAPAWPLSEDDDGRSISFDEEALSFLNRHLTRLFGEARP